VTIEAEFDLVRLWLQEIAKNTAQTRDAVTGRGGSGSGKPAEEESRGTRWERATDALAKRFESALAKWQRTPVEKLIHDAFNGVTQRLDSAIGTGLAHARGLANRGFGGTVEGARYDFAMERLSRQFAAVMMPVMQALTYGAEQIELRMRRWGGAEQNRALGAGLGAYAGWRAFGPMGALAGGILGAGYMATGDMSTEGRFAHAGASAYLGWRVAGPYGAGAAAAASVVETSSDYRRAREGGVSRIGATAISLGAGLYDLPHTLWGTEGGERRDAARRDWDRRGPPGVLGAYVRGEAARADEARRDVTPYKFDIGEAGSNWQRIQEAVMKATGAGGEDGGPFKPLVDIGLRIIDLLTAALAAMGGTAPPPRPAGG
jgi:hypothetical protein